MDDLELTFLKHTYNGKSLDKKIMTRAQIERLDDSTYDFFYADCLHKMKFRDSGGTPHDWPYDSARLDYYSVLILKCMLSNPGVLLTRETIRVVTGLPSTALLHLPSHVLFLRDTFGEKKRTQRFICSTEKRPLKIWWPGELTYLWIEPHKEGILAPEDFTRKHTAAKNNN